MALGDKIKSILGGANQLIFNPDAEPSAMDVMNAEGPLNENRGVWNILSNIGKLGAKQRVTNESLRDERAKRAADLELKKAQAGYYQAGSGLRGAQEDRTRNLIDVDNAKVEISQAKNDNDLTRIEEQGKSAMLRAEAFMKMAEASMARATNDAEKMQIQQMIDQMKIEADKWKTLLNYDIQKKRNEILGQTANTNQQRANTYATSVANQNTNAVMDRGLKGLQAMMGVQQGAENRASRERIADKYSNRGGTSETIQMGEGQEMSPAAFKGLNDMILKLEKDGNQAGADALRAATGMPKQPGLFESKQPVPKTIIKRKSAKPQLDLTQTTQRADGKIRVRNREGVVGWIMPEAYDPAKYTLVK